MSANIWQGLSKGDTLILKGIAIIAIMLHNFMWDLPGSPGFNEFGFSAKNVHSLIQGLLNTPQNFFQLLLVYFGHYGVQAFIFISAYGLTKSFQAHPHRWLSFMRHRFSVIYPTFLLVICAYFIRHGLTQGFFGPIHFALQKWHTVVFQLLLVAGFIPGMATKPVAPWWFISFIFQFYVIFPLLYQAACKQMKLLLIPVIFGLLAEVLLNPWLSAHDLNINEMVFGHLSELCLGIYFAKTTGFKLTPLLFIAALIVFILGNFYYAAWLFSFAAIIILMIYGCHGLLPIIKRGHHLKRVLTFYGKLALPLFLIQGFLYHPLFRFAEHQAWWWLDLMAIAFVIQCTFIAQIIFWIERYLARVWSFWKNKWSVAMPP